MTLKEMSLSEISEYCLCPDLSAEISRKLNVMNFKVQEIELLAKACV